jgi:hypothetical protein
MKRQTQKETPPPRGFFFYEQFVRPYAPFVAGMREAGNLPKKFPGE